jgi:hypothetical protein
MALHSTTWQQPSIGLKRYSVFEPHANLEAGYKRRGTALHCAAAGNGVSDIRCWLAPGRFQAPCYKKLATPGLKWCETVTDAAICENGG